MRQFLAMALLAFVITSCTSKEPFEMSEVMYPSNEHLRGLSVVSKDIVWASGTHGTVLRSIDGGENWDVMVVPGAEELDFRDIQAFDAETALVMSAGNPGRIYKTEDGGQMWRACFNNTQPGIFLDGMAFDGQKGMVYGDPLQGMIMTLRTYDAKNFNRAASLELIPKRGEAGFAASGTGVDIIGDKAWFGTGGAEQTRVFRTNDMGYTWNYSFTPIRSGEGAGIFSLVFADDLNGIAVGGDYRDSTRNDSNIAITADGGVTWELLPAGTLGGYRSCVAHSKTEDNESFFIACGRTGAEYSTDGREWKSFLKDGYYVVDFVGETGWMVGRSGKMIRIIKK